MTTDELIARLEGLEGPCRETDAMVAVAFFPRNVTADDSIYAKVPTRHDKCELGTFWKISRSGMSLHTADRYTESLDAALTLVPEGWRVYSLQQQNDGKWFGD